MGRMGSCSGLRVVGSNVHFRAGRSGRRVGGAGMSDRSFGRAEWSDGVFTGVLVVVCGFSIYVYGVHVIYAFVVHDYMLIIWQGMCLPNPLCFHMNKSRCQFVVLTYVYS